MKRIFVPIAALVLTMVVSQSCRMAPSDNLGDTVSAALFEPPVPVEAAVADTAALDSAVEVQDSAHIYYVGDGSTKERLQLVSYPSRRDTMAYVKGKHIKVSGNADYGRVVRVNLWVSEKGDTLVTRVEEIQE